MTDGQPLARAQTLATSLPFEVIVLVLDALVEVTCRNVPAPALYYMGHELSAIRSALWNAQRDHPVRVMGQVCRQLRLRAKTLMWAEVLVFGEAELDEAFRIYRYLRCVDPRALDDCKCFIFRLQCETFDTPVSFEWYVHTFSMTNLGETVDCLKTGPDGRIILSEAEERGEAVADMKDVGLLNSAEDAWALLRFILERLVNAASIRWQAFPDLCHHYGERRSVVEVLAELPKLRRLELNHYFEDAYLNLGHLWYLTKLEELHINACNLDVELPRDWADDGVNWLAIPEHRNLEPNANTEILWFKRATKLRTLCTTHFEAFRNPDFVPVLARLDVHAAASGECDWRQNTEELLAIGKAGAALRPVLLDFVEARERGKERLPQEDRSLFMTAEEVERVATLDPRLELISNAVREAAGEVATQFNGRIEADGGVLQRPSISRVKLCPGCLV